MFGALALSVPAAAAAAAPMRPAPEPAVGKYCSNELGTQQRRTCFTSENGLLSYGSALASVPLVAVYDRVDTGDCPSVDWSDRAGSFQLS